MRIFPLGAPGGQTADREASSCNAAQLPRFLVIYLIITRLITTLMLFVSLLLSNSTHKTIWKDYNFWMRHKLTKLLINVPLALQRHQILSGTLCQHLFWTVTLWHYLKLDLKLLFSLLFLANCIDLSASASEAIEPRRSINRVLILILILVLLLNMI